MGSRAKHMPHLYTRYNHSPEHRDDNNDDDEHNLMTQYTSVMSTLVDN